MLRQTITFTIAILFSSRLCGQILNINKSDIDADSSHFFTGRIDGKFNINNQSAILDQDVVFKGLDAKADLLYVADKHAYTLINKLNYFS